MLVIEHLRACDLFSELSESTLHFLAGAASVQYITGGETLFNQGDTGDALYLVVLGRLSAILEPVGESPVVLGEIGPGEYLGEMALIASVPRGATIRALRDSTLIRISADIFAKAIEDSPAAALAVARTVILRSRPAQRATTPPFRTLAILPSGPGALRELPTFLESLSTALSLQGPTATVTAEAAHAILGRHLSGRDADQRWSEVEDRLERSNRYAIYAADLEDQIWRDRCIRNGDRLLVVAASDDSPTEREAVLALLEARKRTTMAQIHLAIVHRSGDVVPQVAGPWLDTGLFSQHYHIRTREDIERMARLMTGTARGMALSGGGSRAIAFVGIMRAFQDAGIPIDIYAGTSGGAIVGGLAAMETDAYDMIRMAHEITKLSKYSDLGPPLVALSSGRNISRLFQDLFGDRCLEDLPRTFLASCTSLSTGRLVVPQRGELWRTVRASTSLPGVFPPVPFGEELLVDGGVVNNFPVDLLKKRCGFIVGGDVSETLTLPVPPQDAHVVSGWSRFWRKFNPFAKPEEAFIPSVGTTVVRAAMAGAQVHKLSMRKWADMLIVPEVAGMGLFDTRPESFEQLLTLGYEAASRALEEQAQKDADATLPA